MIIRILLTTSANPVVTLPSGGRIGARTMSAGSGLTPSAEGQSCVVDAAGVQAGSEALRIEPSADGLSIINIDANTQRVYRGVVECRIIGGGVALINELPLEDYLRGLAEEPDSEPFEKQRAFAIAARSYALSYISPDKRKFPGQPYDGTDDPATFQAYQGMTFERGNPQWVKAVTSTATVVLRSEGEVLRAPYFSSDDGRTRSPAEAGWKNFPHAELFSSKSDPWCRGLRLSGHGVGMSGCGARGQAKDGKTAEEILRYYYPGAVIRN